MSVKCVLKHLSGQTHQEGFSSHQPFASLMMKSCHFHENTSPSSEMYPKSLWAQRGPCSLWSIFVSQNWTMILLQFDILLCWHTENVWKYYSSFSAGNYFLLGAFFITISKKGKGWVNIYCNSRHASSTSWKLQLPEAATTFSGSYFFVQGPLKFLY